MLMKGISVYGIWKAKVFLGVKAYFRFPRQDFTGGTRGTCALS